MAARDDRQGSEVGDNSQAGHSHRASSPCSLELTNLEPVCTGDDDIDRTLIQFTQRLRQGQLSEHPHLFHQVYQQLREHLESSGSDNSAHEPPRS